MANQKLMVFRRTAATMTACLEFSWVPTGHRIQIILAPGVFFGSDTYDAAEVKIVQLQVYRLTSDAFGIDANHPGDIWLFPLPIVPGKTIVAAEVNVSDRPHHVAVTVTYDDGTDAMFNRELYAPPLPCPEGGPSGHRAH